MKGSKRNQNWTLQGGPLLISSGSRSGFKPTHAPSSAALFQCRNTSAPHKPTSRLAVRASNKGAPNSVSKNHISVRCKKRTLKPGRAGFEASRASRLSKLEQNNTRRGPFLGPQNDSREYLTGGVKQAPREAPDSEC